MPLIRFLIGGVQKGGTSALAAYLGRHPGACLPPCKEAHVFDRPETDNCWRAERIDVEYRRHFPNARESVLHGDATPIYMLHPRIVERVAAYNAAMKWIILLRDPVDRAISHYHMERRRDREWLPLWAALLAEPWRLHGRFDDFSIESPLRRHSYRARGLYSRQLDALQAHFPRGQILILRSMDLMADPQGVMERVYLFLGLSEPAEQPVHERVFEGGYDQLNPHPWVRRVLRLRFRRELRRLQHRHGIGFDV
ncbi:MAG: sulfotransferase family protein [Luteimonas sp.]